MAVALAAGGLSLASVSPSEAALTTFTVYLSGDNEVPAVSGGGSGVATFTFNDQTNVLIHQFTVGNTDEPTVDLSKPHMFYSRPKGTYEGADTKNILLDFFLINTNLSPDGYKVRATIDGNEFMLTKWVPYIVKGLPMGDNTFKLELLDKDGNLVDSPFNPVERTITLKPSA